MVVIVFETFHFFRVASAGRVDAVIFIRIFGTSAKQMEKDECISTITTN